MRKVKHIMLKDAKPGDIISFAYTGGSNYGGIRNFVKVIESAYDNEYGNLIAYINPYGDKDFRQFKPSKASNVSLQGTFNPEARLVDRKIANDVILYALGGGELAKAVLKNWSTVGLCTLLEHNSDDKVSSVTYNGLIQQYEFHPVKPTAHFDVSQNGNFIVHNKSGKSRAIYASPYAVPESLQFGTESYTDPMEFAQALVEFLS